MAKIQIWLTFILSFLKEAKAPAEDNILTYHTPLASPNFQHHEPSSEIFIPQQSGMAKKPLSVIMPPRKEKAAVYPCISIPMPIDKPSEFLVRSPSTNGETSSSSKSKGILVNAHIQEKNKSTYKKTISPIVKNLREQELGKLVLGYAIPITGLLILIADNILSPLLTIIVITLCVGLVCLWNGLLLRGAISDKLASSLELFGTACVLFAFFSVIGSFLPPELAWIAWVCFLTCLMPFAFCFFHVKEMTLANGNIPV